MRHRRVWPCSVWEGWPQPRRGARRRLVNAAVTVGLHKSERVTVAMIEIKRPDPGIEPVDLVRILGRELNKDQENDEPITWDRIRDAVSIIRGGRR